MIPKSLQQYFKKHGVAAEAVAHKTVYTAYDLAQTTGIELARIAKAILVKVEPHYGEKKSKYVIVVLPASHQLDFAKLKKILKVKKVSIPKEGVMAKLFRLRAGALTAFGPLHKSTPVVVDRALVKSKKILARSGSFTDSLLLGAKDFLKVSGGVLAGFATKAKRR